MSALNIISSAFDLLIIILKDLRFITKIGK